MDTAIPVASIKFDLPGAKDLHLALCRALNTWEPGKAPDSIWTLNDKLEEWINAKEAAITTNSDLTTT